MSRFLKLLRCMIAGHDYQVHQAFTPWSRRLVCDCCNGDFAMSDSVRAIVPWNGEFEELYRRLGHEVRPTASQESAQSIKEE